MGGHVIFSHYKYFDDLIDDALGEGDVWNVMERVSYVWMRDRYVAYPFQNNIAALPIKDQEDCLSGLVEAKVANALAQSKPKNFDDWILRVMGEGIANIFMRPYNFKVWAIPTTQMQCEWLGERVATVDVKRAISNVLHKKEDAGWGPNATFRFPKTGGTGHIWKSVANLLPQNKLKFNCTVTNLNPDKKTVTLKDGKVIQYNKLLTTIPLDITLNWIGENELAEGLFYSTSNIIGLGIRGKHPHDKKCWLYYPEDNCPFYRTTVFSNYAEKNCPDASVKLKCICRGDLSVRPGDEVEKDGPYWSLMFEVSESSHKPVNHELIDIAGKKWSKIVQDTIQGAINVHLMDPDDEIVSIYHRRLEHGYPTPTVVRDGVLQEALPLLRQKDIWSRGRFGSYKYEVANQDHSCMIGVEAVDNMLFGTKELTLEYPNIVNPKKNMELLYYRVKEGEKASS